MKKGDRVKIYNRTLGGEMILEGIATLVKKFKPDEKRDTQLWDVRFDGDEPSQIYRRIVEKENLL